MNIQPLTAEHIYNLSRDDINKLDRGATYNWDTRADDVSDVLIITSLVSPALLTFSDEIRNKTKRRKLDYYYNFYIFSLIPIKVAGN
ncbi:MAG: hypothetical protein V3V72_01025 [Ignavibacteriaceae bacterium]